MNKDTYRPAAVRITSCTNGTVDNVTSTGNTDGVVVEDSDNINVSRVNHFVPSKLKPLVTAIKKPLIGRVKVWHVVGLLITIIAFPFLKDVATYEYKKNREKPNQEQTQLAPKKLNLSNQ